MIKKPTKKKKYEVEQMIVEVVAERNLIDLLADTSFGREDLDRMSSKINEIIKHLNEHKLR